MQRQLDAGMSQLFRLLLSMAGHVEQAIEAATETWRRRNPSKAQEVIAIETRVNQANIEVDDACVKLLATQQPAARDLRLVVAILKINVDLERMVDLAVNITQNTDHYLVETPLFPPEPLQDLSDMADEVRLMTREVLNAFVQSDDAGARKVLHRDDRVDAFKRKIVDDVLRLMQEKSEAVVQGLNVILIAKNLERIGDHATNIAEDIIFISSGEDVRHSAGSSGAKDRG